MLRLLSAALISLSLAPRLSADVPNIAADIAPVHGLVSMVTQGITKPNLLIGPADSPHLNAMRPSVAAALQDADVVFWIGPNLTPWLADPLETLAPTALHSALLSLENTQSLAFRDVEEFGSEDHEDHDHEEHDHEEHDHEDHEEHDDHDHTGIDPHAWLDPVNTLFWLDHIAKTLASIDPDNAETYTQNAATAYLRIAAEMDESMKRLAPLADRSFVVFHDAYHYFEAIFGLEAVGALSLSDAVSPSPSHIARIRENIQEQGVVCVFSEPQFSDRLVQTLIDGTSAKTVQLDPLGAQIATGADFYPTLLRNMTDRFVDCLQ